MGEKFSKMGRIHVGGRENGFMGIFAGPADVVVISENAGLGGNEGAEEQHGQKINARSFHPSGKPDGSQDDGFYTNIAQDVSLAER